MYNKLFRLCSMLLAITMLCNMLPLTTFAANIEISTTNNVIESSDEIVEILGEVETLRTATGKHFRMSDGSFMAVDYGVPVHYRDASGQWQEIDNRVAASKSGGEYAARNGDAVATYAADLINGQILTASYGDVSVTMSIIDQDISASRMEMNDSAQLMTYNRESVAVLDQNDVRASKFSAAKNKEKGWSTEDLIPAGLSATILYEDVFPGIDLQYTTVSHNIKEQIIVKKIQDNYSYSFKLSLDGLNAVSNSDGSISLNTKDGETIYTIPAPYMEDDAGAVSTDVSYTITAEADGIILTVTADRDWINDETRVLPVRIDPTLVLETGYANQDIYTAFAMEAAPSTTSLNWWTLYVGNYPYKPENLQGLYRLFVHFNHLPSIPTGSVITEAKFGMHLSEHAGRGVSEIALAACDVTTELPAAYNDHREWFKAITWRNQPQYNTDNAYDYVSETTTPGYHLWDLTDAAKHWYFEGSDPTIAIVAEDETMLTVDNYRYAGFNVFGSGTPPVFCITYRSDVGLEDYYSYTPLSAGRTGTGYINNYTGNLVWVRNDMGFGGNRMPVSINHIYNANGAANNQFGLGYGWRTNYNQTVTPTTINNETQYVWEDADGTSHYFFNDSGTYRDEDGLELTMTVSNGYTITDKYGNKSYFDTAGRLYKQENNQATKSSINITYTDSTNSYISTITDGAGRVYSFEYSGGLLNKISYSSEPYYTTYAYDNANLTSVTDKDGNGSSYAYGNSHLLTTVTDLGGYKLQFGYQATASGNNSRVVSVAEYDGSTPGGTLVIEYAHNQTTMTDVSGNVQIMQFNNWGNLVSVQDGEGRAQFAKYAKDENSAGKSNQLDLSSKLQNTVGNHVRDSSFENNEGLFSSTIPSAATVTTTSSQAYHGNYSLKIVRTPDVAGEAGAYYYVSAQPGETYTFSAYVKTGNSYAALVLEEHTSSQVVYHRGESLPANRDWTRLEMSYTNTSTTDTRSIALLVLGGNTGECYVDCVQFEKAPTASRYNLINNGDFRHSLSGWSYQNFISLDGIYTRTAAAPELEATVVGITGNPLQPKRLTQTVNVSGNSGDTFVLSGWAKGDSVPIKDNRKFAIIGTFHYTDGSTKDFTANFNPDADSSINWQYSSTGMVAEKAYSSITVTVAYDYNVNMVYFDGIQLFKEEFGTSYTYDGNGNVKTVKDIQGGTTTYTYNTSNDLISITLPDNTVTTYAYDNYHNVTTATTHTGVVYTFGYDTYGNNTSVSVGNGITATATYNNSGNTLYQTTDAAGNTTTYNYNANTNVLEWVKYPKDTDATKTSYTYDSLYRMATAAVTTDTNTALTASYTYTDDLLTKLQTGSSTYHFSYGNFDQRSNIKVGNRTLASYTYTDRTNYLAAIDYGNGDKVQYEYDNYGRVTSQTYEDGDTVSYKYDNNGALAAVTDSATGRTTTYYYDFTDRMMKYVESGSGYSHSVGYTYDELNNLTALVETINGTTRTTSYTYDADKRVTSISTNGITESYSYDAYGRITTKVTKNGSTTVLTETYTYKTNSAGQPTSQVATMRSVSNGRDITYSYTYDANGNITSVSDGTNTTSYAYDSANQLIRENNQEVGESWTWTYDAGGNIASRTFYYYSDGDLGGARYAWNYGYNDSDWGELLTDWWGLQSSYDEIGNLINSGVWSYTWEHGRQMQSMTDGVTTWNFYYDANGMRIGRSNGSWTYSYVYNGSQLSQMSVNGIALDFTYDASGRPLSVTYDGTTYYYALNLQGDVVAILDSSGNTVVSYSYDAWGYERVCSGLLKDTLGYNNPLRYRGYVCDPEYKLYYLQSRYYDPGLGTFNAPDAFVSTGQGIMGNNMFAYCLNNPVALSDASGSAAVNALSPETDPFSNPTDDVTTGSGMASGYIITVAGSAIIADGFERSLADELEKKLAKSYTASTTKSYKTTEEVHHIVPRGSRFTSLSRAIVNEVIPFGVENPINKISIDTKLHRHLHTHLYYGIVNISIASAYAQGDTMVEQQRNVVVAIAMLRGFIMFLDKSIPNIGG